MTFAVIRSQPYWTPMGDSGTIFYAGFILPELQIITVINFNIITCHTV